MQEMFGERNPSLWREGMLKNSPFKFFDHTSLKQSPIACLIPPDFIINQYSRYTHFGQH